MPVTQVDVEMRLPNGSRRMEVNSKIEQLLGLVKILGLKFSTWIEMLTFNLKFSHPAQLLRSHKTLGKVKVAHGQACSSPKET